MATEDAYTDRDENGRFYTVDDAQAGWLIGERIGRWPSGDLRIGVITEVRGGGFCYIDYDGHARLVPDRRVFAVSRPVGDRDR